MSQRPTPRGSSAASEQASAAWRRGRVLWLGLAVALAPTLACTSADVEEPDEPKERRRDAADVDGGSAEDAGPQGPTVEIGIPDEENSTTFVELDEDGDVLIQDGGQGGTHALISLRFEGFGNWILYQVGLNDIDGDSGVETAPLPRARPVPCDGDVCRVSPIFVQLGGLADRNSWDGLHVEIRASVENEEGVEGMTSLRAYLRR